MLATREEGEVSEMNYPPHGEIAHRAYAIWEREGRPHGRDVGHWLEAEREVQRNLSSAESAGPAPATNRPVTARGDAKSKGSRRRKPAPG